MQTHGMTSAFIFMIIYLRYGDPLDPAGDLKSMMAIHRNLRNNGLLFLGVPSGADALVWNAHRIYGRLRLPLLFNGFQEMEWFQDKEKILSKSLAASTCPFGSCPQPVVVLKKQQLAYGSAREGTL